MTRFRTRTWAVVASSAAVSALLAATALPATAAEIEPAPPATEQPADSESPFGALRADPRLTRPAPSELLGATGKSLSAGTGSISGTVTYTDLDETFESPLGTGYVEVLQWNAGTEQYDFIASALTSSSGAYTVAGLAAGAYTVAFFDDATSDLLPEYWPDAERGDLAVDISVADGEQVTGKDERLEPMLTDFIAGADRYATGVAISMSSFDPGVPCVYIASGANFPDALSAGPAASACGGPLLLVPPTSIPQIVADELVRLAPGKIVIAGGPSAVSNSVQTALSAYSPSVKRLAGADRYETSRKIVADAFPTAEMAWVATGANFPDALAASAAAAVDGFPVLIVPGSASTLDKASADALVTLQSSIVAIAGGTAVVSSGVEQAIEALPNVQALRLAGADRYQTALAINEAVWDPAVWQSTYAFLVNGTKFPDALAGAPLAGYAGGPLHVVPPTCTPTGVAQNIVDLGVYEVYLLGYFSQESFNGKPFHIC